MPVRLKRKHESGSFIIGTIEIFGINVTDLDERGLVEHIITLTRSENTNTISYINAHCVNLLHKYPQYKEILSRSSLVYTDGVGVVWGSNILGRPGLTKITGADWIKYFCELADRNTLKIFIIAGGPGIAERSAEIIKRDFKKIQISGVSNGFLDDNDQERTIKEINANPPDVLFIGMGSPIQEYFMDKIKDVVDVPVIWCVGALFDYVSGRERRAPKYILQLSLEWFWRLLIDPVGKWRRYVIGIPVFMIRVLREYWKQLRQN